MESERLLDVPEAASYLHVQIKTIYNWVSQKKLKYIKLGSCVRFKESDLFDFINKNIIEPVK